jgi:hypothetical protein
MPLEDLSQAFYHLHERLLISPEIHQHVVLFNLYFRKKETVKSIAHE